MRAARTDSNQLAIVAALRAVGATVQPLHRVGDGCPDLLVGYCGKNYVIECKREGEKLNKLQKSWHAHWRGPGDMIAYSPGDALDIIGAKVTRIGRYPVIEAS